jgi:hypothetical protein
MGALGERFLLYRLTVPDTRSQARRRLGNRGRETRMREELAAAVAAVLSRVEGDAPRPLADLEVDRLVDLADFVVRACTAVERDGYSREVEVMPQAEAPGRLVGALGAFLAGLEAVGATSDTAWRVVTKAGWDCVPDVRRRLLLALRREGKCRSAQLVTATGVPKATTDRTLEDLSLLELVEMSKAGESDNAAWVYQLSPTAVVAWPDSSSETSGSPRG